MTIEHEIGCSGIIANLDGFPCALLDDVDSTVIEGPSSIVGENVSARRIVRKELINGILNALWDDGNGNRHYAPLEDEHGEPNW